MKKILLFSILFSVVNTIYAQKERKILYGRVFDSLIPITNAHIYNLNIKTGTFSDENGYFRVMAKENDSLQITCVGFEKLYLKVQTFNLGLSENRINLKPQTEILDEVIINNHNLTGYLELDYKQTPKDSVADLMSELLKGIMNMDMNEVNMDIDDVDRMKAPLVSTDPVNSFQGANILSVGLSKKSKKRLEYLKIKELEKKRNIPNEIINLLSIQTIENEFNLPKNKIHNFLDFCSYNPKTRIFLNKKNIYELIKHLKEESIYYRANQE